MCVFVVRLIAEMSVSKLFLLFILSFFGFFLFFFKQVISFFCGFDAFFLA